MDVFLRKAIGRVITNQKKPTYTQLLKEIIEEDFGEKWPMNFNYN